MITSEFKKCSILLNKILEQNNLEDSQLPLDTKMTSVLKTVDKKVISVDSYLQNGLKRKLWNFTKRKESDEPPAKKKIVNIISDSEEESDEPSARKKIAKVISDSGSVEKSAYELMIEKKRIERQELLESLKMEQVKSDFSAAVNGLEKKPKRRFIKVSYSKVRSSTRLENIHLSKDKLYNKPVKNSVAEVKISIPSKLSFSKALGSKELYETYVKDINIEKEKHFGTNYVSYNRSILENLNLDDKNIVKVVRGTITALAWYPSANDLIFAAGSHRGDIGIWNVASESDPHVFSIHNGGITNALFNPFDGNELLTSSLDGTLRCGDMVKHVFSEVYKTTTKCRYFDILSPRTYLVGLSNGMVTLVDQRMRAKRCSKNHLCHDDSIRSVSIHPVDRNVFVTAENKGSVRLWDLRKLRKYPVAEMTHHTKCVNSAFFSPVTGNSILTTSVDDSICIFDSTNLTQDIKVTNQMKHKNHTEKFINCRLRATWLPNSEEIFAVGRALKRTVQLYDKNMKRFHQLQPGNLAAIPSINIFHPFKPALAVTGNNCSGTVFVFT